MATRACVFLVIVFFASHLQPELLRQMIVWNVGQGQWVTILDEDKCWHFDSGGEWAPWDKLMRLCRERENHFSLSHWDWDHISFMGKVWRYLPQSCLISAPLGPTSPRKRKMLSDFPLCSEPAPFDSWVGQHAKTSNGLSRVVAWQNALLPGDSTTTEEKIWSEELPQLKATRILVLGHHGSHSSTSALLLTHLPRLQMTIASARRRRYGHPHREIERRLRALHIPLLRTEDWGSIGIAL